MLSLMFCFKSLLINKNFNIRQLQEYPGQGTDDHRHNNVHGSYDYTCSCHSSHRASLVGCRFDGVWFHSHTSKNIMLTQMSSNICTREKLTAKYVSFWRKYIKLYS